MSEEKNMQEKSQAILEDAMNFFVSTALELIGNADEAYLQFNEDYTIRLSVEPVQVDQSEAH